MHILFVTPNLPIPTSSARVRPFNLIRQLATCHQVSVLSFIRPSEYSMLHALEPYCHRIELTPLESFRHLSKWRNRVQGWLLLLLGSRPRALYTFPVKVMREPLRNLVQTSDLDVVHFEQLYLAELRSEVGQLPAVLGEQNIEFQAIKNLQQVSYSPIHKIRDELSWRKMLAFETRSIRQFPVCLAVSEQDASLLREVSGDTEVHVVTNGVDSRAFASRGRGIERRSDTVLFFGTLNYGPNRDGIRWFCRDIWPMIHSARPDARLEIVGIDPPPDVMVLNELPGVEVTGFVPDIRSKLWAATLSIAPLRWGGGTRLKILEALAAGCPTISTSAGAEGLDLDGKEILIADTGDEFARAVIELLQHPDKRAELSAAGQLSVAAKYDWSVIAQQLEKAYARAIQLTASASVAS